MLKRDKNGEMIQGDKAAAFGRLCVETKALLGIMLSQYRQPPSGGCVLKPPVVDRNQFSITAAAFGRLCVETSNRLLPCHNLSSSRLRAAVC